LLRVANRDNWYAALGRRAMIGSLCRKRRMSSANSSAD